MKIRIIKESLTMPAIDPRVLKLFLASIERLRALRASVEEVSIPFYKKAQLYGQESRSLEVMLRRQDLIQEDRATP
jgi:Asp-tRNA(Asn)/Glu-tRNA(Gln) amidotransferase A subunit family amidase